MKFSGNKPIYLIVGAALLFAVVALAWNWSYLSFQADRLFKSPDYVARQEAAGEAVALGEPNMLAITSLGISAPIVASDGNTEADFQEALQRGVVHYPGTAPVGEVGNTYIFGHSSDHTFKGGDYKTVFALLPSIQDDAEIIISNADGEQFRYEVYEQFVAESTDTHLLDQETGGEKILTLQTSYPIGTALRRYIVKARIVE